MSISAAGLILAATWVVACPVHLPESAHALLQLKQVQTELRLSEAQVEKIERRCRQIAEELMKAEKGKKREVLQAGMRELAKHELTKEQQQRLKELEFQVGGVRCFLEAEVRDELKLTEKQQEAAKKLRAETMPETLKAIEGKKAESEKQAAAMAVRRKLLKQMISILDNDQVEKWKKLTGAPFDFDFSGHDER